MSFRWRKKLLCLPLTALVAFSLGFGAVQAADRSDEVNQLQQQLEQIKQQLSELSDTVEDAQDRKDALQQQSDVLKQQISLLLDDIDTTKAAVAEAQQQIDQKQQEIEDTDALFQERLRAMQVTHTSGILSTLLGANSVDQLLTVSTTLSRISAADTSLLEQLSDQKADLEVQQQTLNEQLASLEEQQTALSSKQDELSASIQAQDSTISKAQADQLAAQSEYEQVYAAYREAVDETNAWMSTHFDTDTPYTGSGVFLCPIQEGYYYISSGFGYRSDPFGGGASEFHNGYDFAGGNGALRGRAIHAAESGVVTNVEYRQTGYGLKVVIDHGGGLTTLYGHCNAIYVSVGQYVNRGDVIAAVGNSGNSTAAHLHFSVFLNGVAQDPGLYIG